MSDKVPIAAVAALGVTQIIGYGTIYYGFSILAPDMAATFGWPVEWIFGALSAALMIGGATAPWLGVMLDRLGAGRVMTIGSAVASAALAGCALSPNGVVYVASLIVLQVAANLVQYGAAFALLVQLRPQGASRSITFLTLIAGFASTIFWPLTTALHGHLSWQAVYLCFAALNSLICLPLHVWLAGGTRRAAGREQGEAPPVEGSIPESRRRIAFILMVAAFSLIAISCAAVLVHMVPLLSGLGLGASAALVGALFGPAQVASRVVNMAFGRNLPALRLALLSAGLISVGVLVLPLSAPSAIGAMLFALLFGMGNGLLSIASGTLPLALFGSKGYGRLQGRIMGVRLVLSAVSPFVLAVAMGQVGIVPSLLAISACGFAAMLCLLAISRLGDTRR